MPIVAPLVGLGTLALVLWVIATALAIAVIIGYIAGVLHGLPYPINQLAGPVSSLAQGISNAAGKLEAGVDRLIGASWHALARYMDKQWHQAVWSSHVLAQSAESLARLFYAHAHLRAIVHKATGSIGAVTPRVKTLEREYTHLRNREKALEDQVAKGIGNDIRIHVKALERTLGRLEHRVIPTIRSTADTAEAKAESALGWTREHGYLPNVRTLEAAGVAILSAVGLNWLRCDSNPFNNNKNACGLWSDLAGLLGLVTTVLIAEDFEALVREMQTLEGDAIGVAKDLFNVG